MESEHYIAAVERWLDTLVIAENLCPFARRVRVAQGVRFTVSRAPDAQGLLANLRTELRLLQSQEKIETALLIHPNTLQDFYDYNQFLDEAEQQLRNLGLEGVFQIASFHPQYQYAGTQPNDPENYANRSPYPLLHLLRESSISAAVADYPDVEQIPARNIARLNALGTTVLARRWQSYFE